MVPAVAPCGKTPDRGGCFCLPSEVVPSSNPAGVFSSFFKALLRCCRCSTSAYNCPLADEGRQLVDLWNHSELCFSFWTSASGVAIQEPRLYFQPPLASNHAIASRSYFTTLVCFTLLFSGNDRWIFHLIDRRAMVSAPKSSTTHATRVGASKVST